VKWPGAVMRSCGVRSVRGSIHAVNHAGTDGVAKETIHTGRPFKLALPSTRAFVTPPPQVGAGTWRTVDCDSAHLAPGLAWSQRRRPITTAAAPPWILYESLSGLAMLHVVTIPPLGPERSDST